MCLRRALAAVSGLDANQQQIDYGTRNSRKLSSTAQGTTRRSLIADSTWEQRRLSRRMYGGSERRGLRSHSMVISELICDIFGNRLDRSGVVVIT